jgi:hypothetical protein
MACLPPGPRDRPRGYIQSIRDDVGADPTGGIAECCGDRAERRDPRAIEFDAWAQQGRLEVRSPENRTRHPGRVQLSGLNILEESSFLDSLQRGGDLTY